MFFRGPKLSDRLILGAGANTAPRITAVDPPAAHIQGGTSVTISGFDFITSGDGTVPEVYFNGVIAENIVVVDRNTITVDSPVVDDTYVGMVSVTVRTVGGSVTLVDGFQFFTREITDISPRNDVIAGGATVTIRGYNFVTGSTVRFGGTVATSTFIDSETYSVVAPAHASGFVDVTITDPDGNVTTAVGGFQYTLILRTQSFRRQPGIVISDTLGDAPNTMSVTLDGSTALPVVGEEIEYLDEQDSDRLLFRGIVQSVAQDYEGQTDQLAFKVNAVDFTFILNKRRPFGSYTLTSASDIVKDLARKYAPDFGTTYVQTNLAKISITFDGSRTFAQCLSDIAQMIGGGHWYLDYNRVIHFFHVVPPGMPVPTSATSTVAPGNTPMTVTEGSVIGSATSFDPGWYIFRRTDYYDNNVESGLGVMSDPVFLDGKHAISFSNVATGVAAGSLNVSKRRIYVNRLLGQRVSYQTVSYSVSSPAAPLAGTNQISVGKYYGYALVAEGQNGGRTLPSARTIIRIGDGTHGIGEAIPPTNYIAGGDLLSPGSPQGAVNLLLYRTEGQSSSALASSATLKYAGVFVLGPNNRYADYTQDASLGAAAPSSNTATYDQQTTNVSQGTTLLDQPERFLQIEDNVTTAFTVWAGQTSAGGPLNPSVSTISNIPGTEPIPRKSPAGRPKGPSSAPSAVVNYATGALGGSAGTIQFRTAWLYRDGTVSFAGPASSVTISGSSVSSFNVSGIPPGPDVNGVACIARLLYMANGAFPWDQASGFGVVVGNSATTLVGFRATEFATAGAVGSDSFVGRPNKPYLGTSNALAIEPDPIPLWPNPDGPYLEDFDLPSDIDDDNDDLLRDPAGQPISVSWDLSQVRNRILVKGRGSVAGEDTEIGATSITVADGNAYSVNGGQILINEDPGHVLRYLTVSGEEGQYVLNLLDPVRIRIRNGEPIVNFLQADNEESQKKLGKIELDSNGNVTDGIHEYTVIDSSLKSSFQMHMRAFAELEVFSNPIVQVRYSTRDPNTRSGKSVRIDLTEPPISGDFLIQDVTIDQIHDESDELTPRYTATASSARFELSDLLLRILDQDHGFSSGGGGGVGVTGLPTTTSTITQNALVGSILIAEKTITHSQMLTWVASPVTIVPAVVGYTILPIWVAVEKPTWVSGYSPTNQTLEVRFQTLTANDIMSGTLNIQATVVTSQLCFSFFQISNINSAGMPWREKPLLLGPFFGSDNGGGNAANEIYVRVAYVLLPNGG